jgi:hypothetical protein
MGQRADLHVLLIAALGNNNVYFQPPENLRMSYPCIVYRRDKMETMRADNIQYKNTTRYSVTVVDPNPDSDIAKRIANLPMCTYDRFYTADKLNHDVFKIFF